MKYIDADKLKESLKKHYTDITVPVITAEGGLESYFRRSEIKDTIKLIDSLQQEQPSEDLESEIEKYFQGLWPGMKTAEQCNTDMRFTPPAIMRLARHFYELGLKAKKE